jgi:5'-nucleotidase / UDP-sugar diphosphatase
LGQNFVMAENIPNIPSGAVPPKKETGKVQPKKETVRINLPPKPSAAPTIKLPTLPPGGPTGATAAPAAPAPQSGAAAPAPTSSRVSAAPVAPRGAAPVAPRPSPVIAAGPTVSTLDTVLAIAAAVVGLIAMGSTLYLIYGIPTQ